MERYLTLEPPHPVGDTDAYLRAALEDIVANYPPRSRYSHEALHGLWSGPTGMAYLLLHVSARRPDLTIGGHPAEHWARGYIAAGSRGHNLRLGSHGCGVGDEKLASEAVRCAVSKDLRDVAQFVSSVSQIMTVEDYPDEMLYGRAGTLYLLRLVRTWVPGSNSLVDPAIAEISNTILSRGPRWKWHDRRYLGSVHGDVGIVTQLVLTSPSLADRLQPAVEKLLSLQQADGNWPSSEESGSSGKGLVQFCHGAPGFVLSLAALRPHFPSLRDRIDAAVKRGRECIRNQGLLRKEPSLCHGIFGNAL
jgi:lantibiotic modifying enzyme